MNKNLIKNYNASEIEKIVLDLGHKKFRATQLMNELHSQRKTDFAEMKTLPGDLRTALAEKYEAGSFAETHKTVSRDGTVKILFTMHDGNAVETVMIPEIYDDPERKDRYTLCVSSQVGCSLNCAFCATGKLGYKRNLEPAEIIDQLIYAEKLVDIKMTNIVYMGMGEPFLNIDNVFKSIRIISDPAVGLMPAKRITVSTSGIVPGIEALADNFKRIKLAISLHATTDLVREKIVPAARKWDLKAIGEAIEYYYHKTKIPLTFEYILFDGLNDSEDDAKRLARISRRVMSKVNLIPYHSIDFTNPEGIAAELKPASSRTIMRFADSLRAKKVTTIIRSSSGEDIAAACGQLAFSEQNTYNAK